METAAIPRAQNIINFNKWLKEKGAIDTENIRIRLIAKSNFTLFASRAIEEGAVISTIPISII